MWRFTYNTMFWKIFVRFHASSPGLFFRQTNTLFQVDTRLWRFCRGCSGFTIPPSLFLHFARKVPLWHCVSIPLSDHPFPECFDYSPPVLVSLLKKSPLDVGGIRFQSPPCSGRDRVGSISYPLSSLLSRFFSDMRSKKYKSACTWLSTCVYPEMALFHNFSVNQRYKQCGTSLLNHLIFLVLWKNAHFVNWRPASIHFSFVDGPDLWNIRRIFPSISIEAALWGTGENRFRLFLILS